MGNEASHCKGIDINEKAIQTTDFWGHYRATVNDSTPLFKLKGYGSLSVFKSESTNSRPLLANQSPLETYTNNLIKYRHPNILHYVWHWQNRGIFYLATEPVQPLSQVLSSQDFLQICVGLHQIVQALDFLHEKALQSHNNINISSIYVLSDGSWKLGGLEFLKPFSEVTHSYLKEIKQHRYQDAIDSKEDSSENLSKIDQYAFCTLVEEVYKNINEDDLPQILNFKQYCKNELQNSIINQRIKFSTLLQHDVFNHEFVSIHKFLKSLPVKTEDEKEIFFCKLTEKLRGFTEETVARQLVTLLLSRLVLLNSAAKEHVIPHILIPKDNNLSLNKQALFTLPVFKRYVIPQLVKMFKVRDSQVRLLLLKYFANFMFAFSKEDLTTHILPELLLGIKDTDDTLVSMTLYCLADLIPVLGATIVIGSKRSKLFTDGRPMGYSKQKNSIINKPKDMTLNIAGNADISVHNNSKNVTNNEKINISDVKSNDSLDQEISFSSRDSIEIESNLCLHERPSPDGGEDLDNEIQQNGISNIDGSDGEWTDWEDNDNKESQKTIHLDNILINNQLNINSIKPDMQIMDSKVDIIINKQSKVVLNDPLFLQKAGIDAKTKKITDINELDIKNQKYSMSKSSGNRNKDEFDFFTDMVPIIEKPSVLAVSDISTFSDSVMSVNSDRDQKAISAKLSFTPNDSDNIVIDSNAWSDVNWDDD